MCFFNRDHSHCRTNVRRRHRARTFLGVSLFPLCKTKEQKRTPTFPNDICENKARLDSRLWRGIFASIRLRADFCLAKMNEPDSDAKHRKADRTGIPHHKQKTNGDAGGFAKGKELGRAFCLQVDNGFRRACEPNFQ